MIEGSVELSGTGADPTPQPLLGEWDFLYLDDHGDDALLRFGQATTLLMLTLR